MLWCIDLAKAGGYKQKETVKQKKTKHDQSSRVLIWVRTFDLVSGVWPGITHRWADIGPLFTCLEISNPFESVT